jgi:N-hydroxyarylamine O-acetyltransferase
MAGAPFDLDAYLRRIGHDGPVQPRVADLRRIHRAHAGSIPFENLHIQQGRPILLDQATLESKLVGARRGGYCFEHNHVLMWALHAAGFEVTPLAAWVRMGAESSSGLRTHMLLRVQAEGDSWIADVGFGADGISEPIQLGDGAELEADDRRYRLIQGPDGLWILQRDGPPPDGWFDLYAFTVEPAARRDFEEGNRYTSRDPTSPFVRTLTVQLSAGTVRPILRNRHLVELHPDGERHVDRLSTDDQLRDVLAERFGVTLEPGARLRAIHHAQRTAEGLSAGSEG